MTIFLEDTKKFIQNTIFCEGNCPFAPLLASPLPKTVANLRTNKKILVKVKQTAKN